VDVVQSGAEFLADSASNYASTLEAKSPTSTADSFNRAVLRRFPRFALEIEDI
jgi:hypothetical protein